MAPRCIAGAGIAVLLCGICAHAQDHVGCRDATRAELEHAIDAHNEAAFRLDGKFRDYWYFRGWVPESVRKAIDLQGIRLYLRGLPGRRPAVLFHSADRGKLCTWLVTADQEPIGHSRWIAEADWEAIRPDGWQHLGTRGVKTPRIAWLKPVPTARQGWDDLLLRVAGLLLPEKIEKALLRWGVETLIVVPITVRDFDAQLDVAAPSPFEARVQEVARNRTESARLTLSISAVPFGALPLRTIAPLKPEPGAAPVPVTRVADRMSVVVAPGFAAFAQRPRDTRRNLSDAIVVGNPKTTLADLQGAEAEALAVAKQLNVRALTGPEATKAAVMSQLARRGPAIDLVHLATHGIASSDDPLDASYLALAGGELTAREISRFGRPTDGRSSARPGQDYGWYLSRRPVVVMSACQTALGKDFPVGTTGLARAWWWIGASNIVMSLWSVDDVATNSLMQRFLTLLQQGVPADKAIQAASLKLREQYSSPAYWAGFAVFGMPETQVR